MSPSARILDALDDERDGIITATEYYEIKYDESCDNPHLRIRARNKPAVMITAGPGAAAPLTQFTLAINEGPYAFGTGDAVTDGFTNFIKNSIYNDAGVMITSSSVSADQKTLTVNLSGLTAGKKVIFNIDLDTTDPNAFMYPDYRAVLFGAPLAGQSATTPGTATGLFVDASSPAPNSNSLTLELTQVNSTPAWMNEHIRPYHTQDKMETMGGEVPEPAGAALAVVGAMALVVRRRFAS